ncbi:MAG: baeRF10 domain-containing protein [Isosphaeraceae bacterium]
MRPIALPRQEIEILLDTPNQRDYVVSAYADMTVRDGFRRFLEQHLDNEARAARSALATAEARKNLDDNIETIREMMLANVGSEARGLAVFSGAARGFRRVVPLRFPVPNRLVIDEEPYILPILEHWFADPPHLVALVDSNKAHFFESDGGRPVPIGGRLRDEVGQEIQRDKPRFTYKKRFAATWHERLHDVDEAPFLRELADAVAEQWRGGGYAGLFLLGRSTVTAAVRRLLPEPVQRAVVAEAAHAMTDRPHDLTLDMGRLVDDWRARRKQQALAELDGRWKQRHLVGDGPTEVLDALQQGRAALVLIGPRRDIPGAHCTACGYRFGAPVATCVYCQGRTRTINAVQDILRLSMRHRVPVHVLRPAPNDDPLARFGGVAALLFAEANWAPDAQTARASAGHGAAV